VNLTQAGRNYGWPVQSFGREYNRNQPVGRQEQLEGVTPPLWFWEVSPAISGLAVYAGALFPQWRGNLFTGALQHDTIIRLEDGADAGTAAERFFAGVYPRIRDVREPPAGSSWFLSAGDGAAYRVTPAPYRVPRRIAPSRRNSVPFSMAFSTICSTNAANSS